MAGIVFAGGEPDSFTPETGTFSVRSVGYDAAFSDCSLYIEARSFRATFKESVSGTFWASMYNSMSSLSSSGNVCTVFDASGRPAFKLVRVSGNNALQVNTSGTATPIWTNVLISPGNDPYFVFSVNPTTREFKFFNGGDEGGSAIFPSPLTYGALTYAVFGELLSGQISQVVISEGVNLVSSRLMTRKANAAGTYSGMTGAYTNLVKTSLNDTTAVVSSTAGQMSTFGYQDVTVPVGLEMHPTVFVWNRVKNDGSSPTSMKPVIVKSGIVEKGSDLPVSEGFKPIPAVWDGMTPAIFNGAEIGMESSL